MDQEVAFSAEDQRRQQDLQSKLTFIPEPGVLVNNFVIMGMGSEFTRVSFSENIDSQLQTAVRASLVFPNQLGRVLSDHLKKYYDELDRNILNDLE